MPRKKDPNMIDPGILIPKKLKVRAEYVRRERGFSSFAEYVRYLIQRDVEDYEEKIQAQRKRMALATNP
ncbi:MAG: hypothetical protein ACP6IS_11110 [Candidatus Asgardarchaeia archaeon]